MYFGHFRRSASVLREKAMNIIAVIPSRYGSSRLRGKPLKLIAGKPMIQRVYELAKAAGSMANVVVATDDHRIVETVEKFGGKAVMTSPENRTGSDRVGETAELMKLLPDDILVNIQGDQPLFDPRCLDELVSPFFSDPDLGMSTLAYGMINERDIANPKNVKVTFDEKGFALYFSRSAIPCGYNEPESYDTFKHLGFYAYKKSFLDVYRSLPAGKLEKIEKLEQLRVLEHGFRIKVVVTAFDSLSVDLPEDIEKIEQIILARKK